MKTQRLATLCERKRRYTFCTACKPSISSLKTLNSNAFHLNIFADLFEIFWVIFLDKLEWLAAIISLWSAGV
jgi:hypothetical protein